MLLQIWFINIKKFRYVYIQQLFNYRSMTWKTIHTVCCIYIKKFYFYKSLSLQLKFYVLYFKSVNWFINVNFFSTYRKNAGLFLSRNIFLTFFTKMFHVTPLFLSTDHIHYASCIKKFMRLFDQKIYIFI